MSKIYVIILSGALLTGLFVGSARAEPKNIDQMVARALP
jgi:hypothetical protein